MQLIELAAPVAELGLRLIRADIKDIMFPGELKRSSRRSSTPARRAWPRSRKARGDTAALRNLANAARLIEGNPALLQIRMLQAFAEQPALAR